MSDDDFGYGREYRERRSEVLSRSCSVTDRSSAPEASFRARIQRFEDGDPAPESLTERLARALYDHEWDGRGQAWELVGTDGHDYYRGMADRAIAVMRGTETR